jgi:hypothetical protein
MGESSYSILIGNGDGTFQAPVTTEMALNTSPGSISTADFNGDGILDLAMLSFGSFPLPGSGNPMILLGNGDGTFKSPQSFSFGESALVVGDFNGDGLPDLAGPAVLLNTSATVTPSSFTLSASPASLTLASGKQGTVTVTVTPQKGFSGPVSFACSGLPAGTNCVFNPSTVTPAGTAATTMLTITAQTASSTPSGNSDPFAPKLIPALVLAMLGVRRWRRRLAFLLPIGLAALTLLSSCGGSGAHMGGSTVTVTATSGSIQQTATISLTVN